MSKRFFLFILIGFGFIFSIFQIIVFLQLVLCADNIQTYAVPGEEDVVIRCGDPDSKYLTITCNVDWGENIILELLEIFEDKKIHITFFVSGKWVEKNPNLARKMYLAGHEIQSHGYGHKLCSMISKEDAREEIKKTEDAIYRFLGFKPIVFAPPSGDYDSKTLEVCREMGYKLSLWSIDTIDWRDGSTAKVISKRVLSKPLNGAIILIHPKQETVKALPEIIDHIKGKQIEIVPLNKLIQY